MLAAAYPDKVQLWSLPDGRPLHQIQDYRNFFGQHTGDLAFSPDGKRLAARSGDQVIRVWDVATGERVLAFSQSHGGRVDSVAYSPDGRLLATGSDDGTVRLWDPVAGKEVLSRRFGTGYPSRVGALTFSPDGPSLAAGGYDHLPRKHAFEGLIELWDGTPGKKAWAVTVDDRVSALAFSPDGKTLAAATWEVEPTGRPGGSRGNPISLRDRATGKELGRLTGHGGKIPALRFSPDGKTLASVGADQHCTWDLTTRAQRSHFTLPARRPLLTSAAFSADGKLLVTSELFTDSLLLWDLATGEEVNRIQVPRSKGSILAVSPDGRLLASGSVGLTLVDQEFDRDLHLWDLVTGREVHTFHPGSPTVASLVFAPDGRSLTSGMDDGTALIWDLTKRAERPANELGKNDLARLWADLGEPDPSRAYSAIWALAATPEKAAGLIRDRLQPAAALDRKRIRELIAALDRSEFAAREAAFKELERLAEDVKPMLRQALQERPTLEQRRRLEGLLAGTRTVRFPETLRQVRAVQLLEYIGTPEAREALQSLANGAPEARLTREAKASLQRLVKRAPGKP
jgi:WD40 repeat protein